MTWLKLKAASQVELSHLLFSQARRPCLEAFGGQIRGFLIPMWDTCLSQPSVPIIHDEVESAEMMPHMCLSSLLAHSIIFACLFGAQGA